MNPTPENQPIEPLEPMNNNPSGKSRINISKPKDKDIENDQWLDGDPCSKIRNNIGEK